MNIGSLKAGDSVRVYGAVTGVAQPIDGRVIQVCLSGMLRVLTKPYGGEVVVHPKQCRRLKKRERRTIWHIVNDGAMSSKGFWTRHEAESDLKKWKEPGWYVRAFVEVRK